MVKKKSKKNKSKLTKSELTKSGPTKSGQTKPELTRPELIKPGQGEPQLTRPALIKPQLTKSELTKSGLTKSEAVKAEKLKAKKSKAKKTKAKKGNAKNKLSKAKAVEVVADFARLARLMRSAEHEIGLNPAQWEALRFLSRCNENANSPIALTRYLGATKGTISQTVIALVKKGLVEKSSRAGERRSVVLTLTDEGHELLRQDPWKRVEQGFGTLGAKKQFHTANALARLLEEELAVRQSQGLSAWASSEFFGKIT